MKKSTWAVLGYLAPGSVLGCGRAATEPSTPNTAALSVLAATTGTDFDPDGYVGSVDRA